MELKLTNTLGRKKEIFNTLNDKFVKIYVCGITPYDYSHIGHGRCYVNFDLLIRILNFLEYKVTYVRNITDIDDKLLNKAEKEGDINKYKEIAKKFTEFFNQDMHKLNCISPNYEPNVTDNIDSIIQFVQKLIDKNHAYVVDNDVYFDILSFPNYGQLSGEKLEKLQLGLRIDINKKKRNPADFVLWKGNDKDLFFKSPWGYGRPGWHIECSVLAYKFLGETLDIHGGGMDLIFPHHENEIAQSESFTDKKFVRYWVHNALVNIDKEKMSKSLGNIFTLRAVFEKFDPMVLRFYFLRHNYKNPIEFTLQSLQDAEVTYKRLINAFVDVKTQKVTLRDIENNQLLNDMLYALCDDLNTSQLFGILFENIEKIKKSEMLLSVIKSFLDNVLGLTLQPIVKKIQITPEIENLISKREEARKNKNWELSDKLRDKLSQLGYQVQDKKISK